MQRGNQIQANALKRINKDYEEIKRDPIEGVGIARYTPDDNFKFIVNFKIMYGIYEGIILQLQMEVPETYPIKPPKMLILPRQDFSHSYHHHIFDDSNGYKKFCIDILDNNFMDTKALNTGWSPGYTFKTLFFQIQNFLADPDGMNPSKNEIKTLRNTIEKYTCEFINEEGKKVIHSFKNPYPELGKASNENSDKMIVDTGNSLSGDKTEFFRQHLNCYLLKNNYIEDSSIILGYPVKLALDFKKRVEPHPVPEILSYEGFMDELTVNKGNTSDFLQNKFKTCMGQEYNYWFPIYLNEDHYTKNKKIILDAFKLGKGSFDEKTDLHLILEIMPAILSKMIIFLLKGESHMSFAAIEAYGHFLMLFNRLLIEFPELNANLGEMIENIRNGKTDKSIFPDVGNLIVILYMSAKDGKIGEDLVFPLLDEYFTRQIFWIFNNSQRKQEIENNLMTVFRKDENILRNFSQVNTESEEYLSSKLDKKFKKSFAKYYDDIESKTFGIHIIENPPKLKTKTEKSNFEECKELYYQIENLKASEGKSEKKKKSDTKKMKTDFEKLDSYLKDNLKDNKIGLLEECTDQSKLEFIRKAFEGQFGNHLLFFTYSAAIKFINPEYISKLRNNYSIIDESEGKYFVNSLNEMKSQINDYEKLANAIGFGSYFGYGENTNGSNNLSSEENSQKGQITRFMQWIVNSNEKKYSFFKLPTGFWKKYHK